jgi:cullin 1
VEEGYNPFLDMFEQHVAKVGRVDTAAVLEGGKANPTAYIDAILLTHAHFTTIIKEGFGDDKNLNARRDRAFRDFINQNAVTDASKHKSRESPRLLAKYCDDLLRKTSDETEKKIEGCMVVFRYLHDNDVFQTYYQKDLAKRLVNEKFDDGAEQQMIAKLKQQCGVEWSRKLQKMYEDIQLSVDLSKVYERTERPRVAAITDVKVLTRAQWPFKPGHRLQLPEAMQASLEHFEAFYSKQHGSRKLAWLLEHSRGEVTTVGFKKPHILTCTAHQMAVLSLFNRKGPLTIREVVERLGATDDEVYIRGVLESLVHKFKLLKLPDKADKVAECSADAHLTLFRKWKIDKKKFNIIKPVKVAEAEETEQANEAIDKQREYIVQAMIVKAMKALQGSTIKHQQLVGKVVQMVKEGPMGTRFNVQPKMIKVQIASLVEQECVVRPPVCAAVPLGHCPSPAGRAGVTSRLLRAVLRFVDATC